MGRRTALVICPGRGTYNKDDLGYLGRHHADKAELIGAIDAARLELGQETVSALDGAGRHSLAKHTRGDNASALIYACAYADFNSIDRDRFDIVAVTGNSMGWYIALATAGALTAMGGFEVVNTMGTLMQQASIGGQIVYPLVGEDWREVPGRRAELTALVETIGARQDHALHLSIDLGGMLVLAGNDAGLDALENALPPLDQRFPMRLANHAAFHTPLQAPVSATALERLGPGLFEQPGIPLIDGDGRIWWPHATSPDRLHRYTFDTQVVEPYHFAKAVAVGIREFAPEAIIVLGPGTTLGGSVIQSLIAANWNGMTDRAAFEDTQARDPLVISMGRDDQRLLATR
jgi:malonyl CoA-acyl carrier protein transacylase